MRWYTARLYAQKVVGKDRLGVEQVKEVEIGWCTLRIAPANATPIDDLANSGHYVERNFLTMKPASEFKGVTKFETRGRIYNLEEVTDLENGQTMIRGIYYKPEVSDGWLQSDIEGTGEA